MKKGAKIALGVAAVLVVAGAAAAVWQWNNLNALRYGLTLDQDTLDQRLEENRTVLNEAMDQYDISDYTFTEEEVSQLTEGTVSAQEAAKKLLERPAQEAPQAEQPEQPPQADHAQEEAEIRELIATMYVLRATYMGKL